VKSKGGHAGALGEGIFPPALMVTALDGTCALHERARKRERKWEKGNIHIFIRVI
jgi:hypothetical protein